MVVGRWCKEKKLAKRSKVNGSISAQHGWIIPGHMDAFDDAGRLADEQKDLRSVHRLGLWCRVISSHALGSSQMLRTSYES